MMLEAIGVKLQLSIDQFRVVALNNCITENSEGTLEEYDIKDKTTVHIVQRARGGSEPPKRKLFLSNVDLQVLDQRNFIK